MIVEIIFINSFKIWIIGVNLPNIYIGLKYNKPIKYLRMGNKMKKHIKLSMFLNISGLSLFCIVFLHLLFCEFFCLSSSCLLLFFLFFSCNFSKIFSFALPFLLLFFWNFSFLFIVFAIFFKLLFDSRLCIKYKEFIFFSKKNR